MSDEGKELEFDFLIIGSGFGGSLVYANTLMQPEDSISLQ